MFKKLLYMKLEQENAATKFVSGGRQTVAAQEGGANDVARSVPECQPTINFLDRTELDLC